MNDAPSSRPRGFSTIMAESLIVVLLTVAYIGLTFFAMWKWNTEISAALVTGFVLYAQKVCQSFFEMVKQIVDAKINAQLPKQ